MLQVLRPRRAVDQDVVEENQHEPAEEGAEHIVHQRLKCRRGVGEPKRHHQELEVAVVGAERRLLDVRRVHAHLVVPRAEVELGEVLGPMELVEELVNHRDRELVLGHAVVEFPVVDAEAPRPIRLLDEEHGCRERRSTGADDALLQHGGALPLELVLLQLRVPVRPHCHRRGPGQQVYAVVVGAAWWKAARCVEDGIVLK